MNDLKFCAPCLFGLEGLVGDELRRLDMKDVFVENGKVLFSGSEADIARANIRLRMAERVLIVVGGFFARSFDELFERTKALPWERYIPSGAAFPVKGYSLSSQLHSVPDCQRIIKKAVVERLRSKYGGQWLAEDGEKYQIQFSLMKDEAVLYIDTSGAGLHKRGYRAIGNAAPLRETLAAAMVTLSRYRGRDRFIDPLCGSGTIPIEAALIALNRAPGLTRRFSAESWPSVPAKLWKSAKEEALAAEFSGGYDISAFDIDPQCVTLSRDNAKKAGVADLIKFSVGDARKPFGAAGSLLVTNPPYGERMFELREAEALYASLGKTFYGAKSYIISSHNEFEAHFGRRATKKRKLYNGMIRCDLYMYY